MRAPVARSRSKKRSDGSRDSGSADVRTGDHGDVVTAFDHRSHHRSDQRNIAAALEHGEQEHTDDRRV